MSVKVKIEEKKDYLEVIVAGTFGLQDLKEVVDALKDAQEKYNATKILVDVSGLSGELVELDRFRIGEYAADVLSRNVRFAMLADDVRINKFFENVATNRGLNVIVVSDRQSALDWLLKGK